MPSMARTAGANSSSYIPFGCRPSRTTTLNVGANQVTAQNGSRSSDREMIIRQVLLHGGHRLSSHAARIELGLELPGRATVARTLAAPTE
jgi:hypothetical protein